MYFMIFWYKIYKICIVGKIFITYIHIKCINQIMLNGMWKLQHMAHINNCWNEVDPGANSPFDLTNTDGGLKEIIWNEMKSK